jgi:hypothetical protein
MGSRFLALAGAVMAFGIGAQGAIARPIGPAMQGQSLVEQVQFVCNRDGCFDRGSGEFTASGCNRQGCYPTGGVVGRMTPDGPRYYGGQRSGEGRGYRGSRGYDPEEWGGSRRSRSYGQYYVPAPQQYPYPLPTPQPEREYRNH